MQYIKIYSTDPRYNLALEEYVTKSLQTDGSIILLWKNAPSVIIGRFQNTVEEINAQYIKAKYIMLSAVLRGGQFIHDSNLNFSFIEKTDYPKY